MIHRTVLMLLLANLHLPFHAFAYYKHETDSTKPIIIVHDIEYGKAVNDHQQLQPLLLDVYRDTSHRQGKPAIIFVHGGGFSYGDKQQYLYVKMATTFASQGYVSFSVNYRLKDTLLPYKREVLDNAIADVLTALQWIKENSKQYGVDTDEIIICGDSAGGAIAVNTSFDNAMHHRFAACIDLWGGMCDPNDPHFLHIPPWDQPIYPKAIAKGTPPTCIIHGTSDSVVPYSTSEELSRKLAKAGIYHELHPLQGADHYPESAAPQFIQAMISFSDKVIPGNAGVK